MATFSGLSIFSSEPKPCLAITDYNDIMQGATQQHQISWSKGISETNLKLKIPCSKCMHQPVTSQADAYTSQSQADAYTSQACSFMYCMHCPHYVTVVTALACQLTKQKVYKAEGIIHRYLKNIDCSIFVYMPTTRATSSTSSKAFFASDTNSANEKHRQYVPFNQFIFLRCLWVNLNF
jgi:hypothetical protein